jgi:hypothetical protein
MCRKLWELLLDLRSTTLCSDAKAACSGASAVLLLHPLQNLEVKFTTTTTTTTTSSSLHNTLWRTHGFLLSNFPPGWSKWRGWSLVPSRVRVFLLNQIFLEGLSQSCEFELYLVYIHIMIADSLLNDFSKEERKQRNFIPNWSIRSIPYEDR